jgi:hypothetical protein
MTMGDAVSSWSVVSLLRLLCLGSAAGGVVFPALLLARLHGLCGSDGCSWKYPLAWTLMAGLLVSAGLAARCKPRGPRIPLPARLLVAVSGGLACLFVMLVPPDAISAGRPLLIVLAGEAISLLSLAVLAWLMSLPGLIVGVLAVLAVQLVSSDVSQPPSYAPSKRLPSAVFRYAGVLFALGLFWLLGSPRAVGVALPGAADSGRYRIASALGTQKYSSTGPKRSVASSAACGDVPKLTRTPPLSRRMARSSGLTRTVATSGRPASCG